MRRSRLIACLTALAIWPLCCGGLPVEPIVGEFPPATVFGDDQDPSMAAVPFVEDELVVEPVAGASRDDLLDAYARAGAVAEGEVDGLGFQLLRVPEGNLVEVGRRLGQSDLITEIHKNYIYQAQLHPDDPEYIRQAHLDMANVPQAWDVSLGSGEVVIAVVDSGIDSTHPDLVDQVRGGWNAISGGADFEDYVGHGTQVAGVAAAGTNNARGLSGVAGQSPVLAVRVADATGRSTSRDLAAGILWAANQEARVINVSFAPLWSNSVVRAACRAARNRGSLVIISAGNSAGSHISPGFEEALFVGALSEEGRLAPFSERGPFVDLVAPGVGIWTTTEGGGYGTATGTSFAAPVVAGVAALVWSVNPQFRPGTVADALLSTCTDLGGTGKDVQFGHGLVHAARAVEAALQFVETADDVPPVVSIEEPAPGREESRVFAVLVSAEDEQAVAEVVLAVDGLAYATDLRPPYVFAVNPTEFSSGEHVLTATAADAAGNTSESRPVMVRFASAAGASDAIRFVSPPAGARVRADVNILADVSSNAGLAVVEWFVDGQPSLTQSLSGFSSRVTYRLRVAELGPGPHRITLALTDSIGRVVRNELELLLE